jgi:hypothetical protein
MSKAVKVVSCGAQQVEGLQSDLHVADPPLAQEPRAEKASGPRGADDNYRCLYSGTSWEDEVITDEGPIWRPERGSEWEPIKILLEGDGNSNMMNTTTKTHLRLNYLSWPDHAATGVLLVLETNTTSFRTKHTKCTTEICTACSLCYTSQRFEDRWWVVSWCVSD